MVDEIVVERLISTANYEHLRIGVRVEVPKATPALARRVVEHIDRWAAAYRATSEARDALVRLEAQLADLRRMPIPLGWDDDRDEPAGAAAIVQRIEETKKALDASWGIDAEFP